MPLLARPSAAYKYIGPVTATANPARSAVTRRDLSQVVFLTGRSKWTGNMNVGPFDLSADAESCKSWLRRWCDDADIWTEIPYEGVTAGDTPTGLEVDAISSSKIVTADAAHGLAKGDGVRLGGEVFALVVTVPSSTTFRVFPETALELIASGDAIEGSRDILAKVVQPAEFPGVQRRGLDLVVTLPWVEN